MKPRHVNAALVLAVLVMLTGCRRDMFNQPRGKPLGESDFFPDGAASRPIPPHTVARGFLEEDDAFYKGMIGTNLVTDIPISRHARNARTRAGTVRNLLRGLPRANWRRQRNDSATGVPRSAFVSH